MDPKGVAPMENLWRHHGHHAFMGVDTQAASAAAVRGGLLIALRAAVFDAEEVQDVVDIVPGEAMALNIVTAGGALTVINVHGPGSGSDSWASPAMRRPRAQEARSRCSSGGTSTIGLNPRDTPPRGGFWHYGNNVGSLGWDTRQRRTGSLRVQGIGRTPPCSARRWSREQCASTRTWRWGDLLRR